MHMKQQHQATILYTPYHHIFVSNINGWGDNGLACFHLRLDVVEAIRSYKTGEKPLYNLLIALDAANELFQEYGYPLMEFNPALK